MTQARVVVVGLGPAGVDLLLPIARKAIERVARRYVRTARHPAVQALRSEGLVFSSFDDLYDRLDTLEAVYRAMAGILARAAADEGEVLYAVPGSPVLAERAVALLRQASDVEVDLVPGLSFAEYAWTRLGIDPLSGARVVDGRALEDELPLDGGTLLIAQCDGQLRLSDLKLSLLERLSPEAPVTVLCHLGLPDERVFAVPLANLDREVTPDHLTSLLVELPEDPVAASWSRFVALVERLRAPGGCPWDAEQTHHSLSRHLLEETYEVLEAIEALPPTAPGPGEPVPEGAYEALAEELGDVACQVVFHATLAREVDGFGVGEVISAVHDKLVRRHPHVFGDTRVEGAEAVLENWERQKRAEKSRTSLVSDVPRSLPALLLSHKLLSRGAAGGLPWGSLQEAADEVASELRALRAGVPEPSAHLGALLGATVRLAHAAGLDSEAALRGWAERYRWRFLRLEGLAVARGAQVEELGAGLRAKLWEEAAIPTS